MKLSTQAIAAVMMALQKGLVEQIDITEMLEDFELYAELQYDEDGNSESYVFVTNPPQLIVELEDEVDAVL